MEVDLESQKDAFRRRYSGMTDGELLDAYQNRLDSFCEAAKAAITEVVHERGGADMLKLSAGSGSRRQQQSGDSGTGIDGGVRILDDETVAECQFALIEGAAGHADQLLHDIQKRLAETYMPLDCRWGLVEVKTKGWISRVRRDFLIVEAEEFPDHHSYISIRDFGTYLDCMRALTVEPGFLKKFFSRKITGDEAALSAPGNLLKYQDLRSWNAVINNSVKRSLHDLVARLGKQPSQMYYGEKSFLDMW
jgi:hypothetical protein